MTKREIVFMACRLMAVYLFMSSFAALSQALTQFSPFSYMSWSSSTTQSLVINFNGRPASALELGWFFLFKLSPVILLWLGATLLWFLAREIAVRLFENESQELLEGTQFTVGTEGRALAFAILGLFFLMQDVPDIGLWLVSKLWDAFRWTQNSAPFGYYLRWEWLLRIPISLWMLFGLRGLAGLWRLAQEKGIAPTR